MPTTESTTHSDSQIECVHKMSDFLKDAWKDLPNSQKEALNELIILIGKTMRFTDRREQNNAIAKIVNDYLVGRMIAPSEYFIGRMSTLASRGGSMTTHNDGNEGELSHLGILSKLQDKLKDFINVSPETVIIEKIEKNRKTGLVENRVAIKLTNSELARAINGYAAKLELVKEEQHKPKP